MVALLHMNTASVGILGEEIAERFLVKRGFTVLERNFTTKVGEVDLICRDRKGIIHFIEVKANIAAGDDKRRVMPEERVSSKKLRHICNVVEVYLTKTMSDTTIGSDTVVDVISVIINPETKKAQVNYIEAVA